VKRPPQSLALLHGLAAAAVMGALAAYALAHGRFSNDFDQLWVAGRALLRGADPYAAVVQAHLNLGYGLYYPLPAVVLTLPFAMLPLNAARWVFAMTCSFIAGYGLRRLGPYALLALLSPIFWSGVIQGQLAPALTGAALVPTLGFLLAAKPTMGLALWISRPSARAALGVAALTVGTIILWPWWPKLWLAAIQTAPHIRPPLARPGGVLLLLAALRWRRPEGRLLVAWACVPRTESLYDLLPLFLVVDSFRGASLLVAGSWLALLAHAVFVPPGQDLAAKLAAQWPWTLLLVYGPALLLVLARPATRGRTSLLAPPEPPAHGVMPRPETRPVTGMGGARG
jgi:hypothetical protein